MKFIIFSSRLVLAPDIPKLIVTCQHISNEKDLKLPSQDLTSLLLTPNFQMSSATSTLLHFHLSLLHLSQLQLLFYHHRQTWGMSSLPVTLINETLHWSLSLSLHSIQHKVILLKQSFTPLHKNLHHFPRSYQIYYTKILDICCFPLFSSTPYQGSPPTL